MATLPTEGPISLKMIQDCFGGEAPTGISEYYRGGKYVPDIPANSKIPTSGTIHLSDFYGAKSDIVPAGQKKWTVPGLYTFTIPEYDTEFNFDVFGAGGSSGESAYDGTVIGSKWDAWGYDGPAGQGSYVTGPDGDIVPRPPRSWQTSQGSSAVAVDPTVTNPWCSAGGGGGGDGWGRHTGAVSLRGSNPGPPSAAGAKATGSVRSQDADDIIDLVGGNAGGPPTPYFGNTLEMGGAGGRGARVLKSWKRNAPDAPQPGQVYKIFVGAGGAYGAAFGGVSNGGPGVVAANWT